MKQVRMPDINTADVYRTGTQRVTDLIVRRWNSPDQYRRFGLGEGEGLPAPMFPALGTIGTSLVGLGGSAVYGGIIGSVASHSWSGGATGALAGATAAAGTSAIFAGMSKLWMQTAVFSAVALGAGFLAYTRWRKTPRKR